MAGNVNVPLSLSGSAIAAFFTKSKSSDSSLLKKLRERAEWAFNFQRLYDGSLYIAEWYKAREMIRRSDSRVSDEMADILAALVSE